MADSKMNGDGIITEATHPMTEAITITYGEVAENHVGQQQITADGGGVQEGLSFEHLSHILHDFDVMGAKTEMVDLSAYCAGTKAADHEEMKPAHVLIVRGGANVLLREIDQTADDMFAEQMALPRDSKYFDTRRKMVLNKQARHNLCFDDVSQDPDYENKEGTIIPFDDVPCTQFIRGKIADMVGSPTTPMDGGVLKAEGNYYYDLKKCGIGFHGDTERKIVVAVRLGVSIPLHYQWFFKGQAVGDRCVLNLNHGDIYFMSEKAVGTDWKRRVIPTLRHAAGADKYLKIGSRSSSSGGGSSAAAASAGGSSSGNKVKNPETNRMIEVGKGVYNALVKKGYVLVNGELVKQ